MRNLLILTSCLLLVSCSRKEKLSDAYGNFEAVTVSVSAESSGKIIELDVEEGQKLEQGAIIGLVDSIDHYLRKRQLMAQKSAVATRLAGIQGQINVQLQQKANLSIEKERILRLLEDKAATPKQLDDINGAVELADKQIASIQTQNAGIREELNVVDRQIDQVNEALRKCYIRNPVAGTVLVKYAQAGEITAPGKTLYKIANLEELELKVYVPGDQLPAVKIGQKVEVLIDKDKKSNRTLSGTVSWISQKAEFTPKIIQTKEERVDLVYGVKIRVPNDGSLKISMPGEVNFNF